MVTWPSFMASSRARLGFWSSAIDFVGEKKICENRPRLELERFRMRVIDCDAYNVTRKHVRGELEPMEFTLNRSGYGMRQSSFADARNILN